MRVTQINNLAPPAPPTRPAIQDGFRLHRFTRYFFCKSRLLFTAFWSTTILFVTSSIAIAENDSTIGTTPTPFTAVYKVTKGIMSVGTTKRKLEATGNDNYVFESVTKPGGIAKLFTDGKVIERSQWRMVDNKLVPQEYTYVNTGDSKRNVKVVFDWETNKVINTVNGDPWSMEIEDDTLDKLIYQLAIMYDLNGGETKLHYQVADGGKTKTYDIEIQGEERIVTELGTFTTIKVSRTNNDRTTIMWCAKELQYLPARISQKKKDDTAITAELVELSGIIVPESSKPVKPTPSQ